MIISIRPLQYASGWPSRAKITVPEQRFHKAITKAEIHPSPTTSIRPEINRDEARPFFYILKPEQVKPLTYSNATLHTPSHCVKRQLWRRQDKVLRFLTGMKNLTVQVRHVQACQLHPVSKSKTLKKNMKRKGVWWNLGAGEIGMYQQHSRHSAQPASNYGFHGNSHVQTTPNENSLVREVGGRIS